MMVSDLLVLILTHEHFTGFSLPCPAGEQSDGVGLVGTWSLNRDNPPQLKRSEIKFHLDFVIRKRVK